MYLPQFRIFFAILLLVLLSSKVNGDEPDINITTIKYTNDFENGYPVTIVSSGKDNATTYNYNFYDDDDDIPENWYAVDFDDSNLNSSAAPFGNYDLDEVSPGTIWQTEDGGLKDYLIIRHHFTYDGGSETIGATLNLAYNNYYAAYLNGNLIRDCSSGWGCSESDAEYWNHELTYDGSSQSGPNPDWLVEGENILAILGRDTSSTWGGGDDEQWLDVELVVNVQSWKENPIVLGDNLVFGIDFFNNEESNVTDLNVTLEIEGTVFANQTVEIETNKTFEWRVEWTPDKLGEINLTAKVLNESLTRFIHVGYYAYNISVNNDYLIGNTSELLTYNITISNEGDVNDNYTFQLFGVPVADDWDVEFVPNIINLAPGETGTVKLEITPDNGTFSGVYELTLTARSQYHGEIADMIVQSGRDNETEWNWVNSTGGRLYEESNTTWTEIDFEPDSNWTLAPAPFGDDDLGSIDYNTEWAGNNYAYFRHIFYIENLSDYENDTLSLNMAANNYGTYYLNGEEIFNDLGWGSGHYAQYWNEEIKFNSSLLKEGNNVLASVVRETGNTQWFDEELVSVTPKSSAWGFQPEYITLKLEVLPVYAFELDAPIIDRAVSKLEACCEYANWTYQFDIWILNRGNIEDSYEINVTLNDTVNFSIVYFDSIIHAEFDGAETINLTIVLNPSVTEFSVGEFNVSVTSMNSTDEISLWTVVKARLYVKPDGLPPGTYTQTPSLVNSSSFNVEWYIEEWYKDNEIDGNDTKYFIIEYMTDSGTETDNGTDRQTWSNWTVLGNFSAEQKSTIFSDGLDGHKYRFRSIGGDDDGLIENKEEKYDSETLVDISSPYAILRIINLKSDSNLTNLNYIEFEWEVTDYDITGYEPQYRFNEGNWTTIQKNLLSKWIGFNIPEDGDYEFRVISSDQAGNQGISEISSKITVDTIAPNTNIIDLPKLTDLLQINIDLENLEDTVNFTLYYSIVDDTPYTSLGAWFKYEDYLLQDLPITMNINNKFHYFFKIRAYDLAGNYYINETYIDFIVDRDPPNNIKDLKINDNKQIVNDTTDIVISFMRPVLQTSDDIIEYRIYRSNSQNQTGNLIATLEYGDGELYIFYKDSGVKMGDVYYYSVSATDRMGFESKLETEFINLTVEDEIIIEDQEEGTILPLYLGAGGLLLIASGAAGYYFIGRKANESVIDVVSEIIEQKPSNFTEMDGDLLCGECGSMFLKPLPGAEINCPSCGTVDDK